MGPDQRKAVLVLLDLLNRYVPALDVVALLTVGSKLATMNVGVAVRAFDADIGEYHPGVTLRAGHALMHSAEGKPSLIMIKLGHHADRLPTGRRVAVLAGQVQISVRAVRFVRLLLRGLRRTRREQQESCDEVDENGRSQSAHR